MKTHLYLVVLSVLLFACNKKPAIIRVTKDADYEKADSFFNFKNDSAYYYYNTVVSRSGDSLLVAMAYNRMGVILSDAGDYYGSQENLLMSLKFLDEHAKDDSSCISSDYNTLGITSLNLRNYEAALEHYDRALKFAEDKQLIQIILNNKAVVYQKTRAYAHAIAIYDSIIIKTTKGTTAYARVLSNRAKTKWLRDTAYRAAPDLWAALQIRLHKKDNWGLNASYAHLSDYYKKVNPDSALIYAGKMYAVARLLNSPDDEMEALEKLIALDSPKNIHLYFARYQYLSDSTQTARNTAKNQFALIRYEVEKNKIENLKLQKENTDKEVQILRQRIFLLLMAGLVIGIGIFLYRRYEKRIHEQKLKTSQKVHDVVANGLYTLMTKVEYQPEIDKESLVDQIEMLYEQSRDISYEHKSHPGKNFQDKISGLLKSFGTDKTKVLIAGNYNGIWEKLDNKTKKELEYILKELMINMKKHSCASNVAVSFKQSEDMMEIHYSDNGKGMPPELNYGNGLTNTVSRINNINGRIKFGRNLDEQGLNIQISFPIV